MNTNAVTNVRIAAQGINGFNVPFVDVVFDAMTRFGIEERCYGGVLSSANEIYVTRLGEGYGYHVGYVRREMAANVPEEVAAALRALFN